jgi:4-carboxymuconolactone decarboxylase
VADDRYARGEALLGSLHGETGAGVVARLAEIAPDLARYIVEFAYGEVWSAPGLAVRDRQVATLAALTALGTARAELTVHMRTALRGGMTPAEVVAVVTHVAVYAGFPAALEGVAAAREAFAAEGVAPPPGDGPAPPA